MEVYEYLDEVEKQIRQEHIREEVRRELRRHIEDQAEFYQEAGMSRPEAVKKAVEDMGDPVETGIQMDMVHQPQLDKRLLYAVGIFLAGEAVIQILYNYQIEKSSISYGATAVIISSLVNFLWVLLYAKRDFFRQDLHKTSTWFFMWITVSILGIFFQVLGKNRGFEGVSSLVVSMLPAIYGGLIFGYRDKKAGFQKLMAVFIADLALGLITGGNFYMFLFIPAHLTLLTMGVKRNWYGEKRKAVVRRLWILFGLLSMGCILISLTRGGLEWKNSIQEYLETPDLLGMVFALAGDKHWSLVLIPVVILFGFFLWMAMDMRKLTNDLCRMLCMGILCGFLAGTLYSLGCIAGFGPAENIFLPLLTVRTGTKGGMNWYFYLFLGMFLNCHKSDRIVPSIRKNRSNMNS